MEILDFIICDDVREEIKNKFTLVGLYNDRIVFETLKDEKPEWPRKIKLSAYVKLRLESKDKATDFSIAICEKKTGKKFIEQKYPISEDHPYGSPFPLLVRILVLEITPGDIVQLVFETYNGAKSLKKCVSSCEYDITAQEVLKL